MEKVVTDMKLFAAVYMCDWKIRLINKRGYVSNAQPKKKKLAKLFKSFVCNLSILIFFCPSYRWYFYALETIIWEFPLDFKVVLFIINKS